MSADPKEILIVEDDAAIATAVALNLTVEGYRTHVVHDGEAALAYLDNRRTDLVLLDISLPKKTGLDVLAGLRSAEDHTPVIILSARQDEHDKVAALKLGADDYVTKPFGVAELLARVAAVLRRAVRAEDPVGQEHVLAFADVNIDLETRTVTRAGAIVALTHLELELLAFLLRHPRHVFGRGELLKNVWAAKSGSKRTVDNFVGQLRAKLEEDPENPAHFVTVRGSGYRFDP